MAFRLHKEGKTSIILAFVVAIALVLVASFLINIIAIQVILFALAAFVIVAILQFFRNPERHTKIDKNQLVSPADGKVVVIEEIDETEYTNEKRIQMSVFMSPVNVHANRYPCSGKVKYVKYHLGKFLVAWHPKSSTLNERTTIAIENENKDVILVKQIAGAVARRIVYYCKTEDEAKQGEQFGFIKFGSRVDLLFPANYKPKVKIGDKVRGGETVLAELDATVNA